MNQIIFENITHFNPRHTFLCGQCFRWEEESDGSFTGIAGENAANISMDGNSLVICGGGTPEFWENYLDLKRDYGKIQETLSKDTIMKTAIESGWGIRILKQDIFECLISFIISANNNIPRIKKIINKLSEMYGDKKKELGKTFYAFPKENQLFNIKAEDLAPLSAGYRAPYIAEAVKQFAGIDKEKIKTSPLVEARAELCKIKGVGPKVADCILLFSAGRFGVFPTDVWVKRVMRELYGFSENETARRGEEKYGELAGIAQQYLFYWRREQ